MAALTEGVFRAIGRLWAFFAGHMRFWMIPTHRFGTRDEAVEQLAAVRAWLGVAIVSVVTLRWSGDVGRLAEDAVNSWFTSLLEGAVILAVVLVVGATVLLAAAPAGGRRRLARHLLVPLRAFGTIGALLAVAGGFMAGSGLLQDALSRATSPWWAIAGTVAMIGALVVFLVFVAALVLVGLRLFVQNSCRAVDGHPALRPIIGIAVAVVTVALGLSAAVDPTQAVPGGWLTAFLLVGQGLTVALSVWELRRLKRRHGIGIRWSPP